MSLLADLPNQIMQVIENATGQRRRKGKKKLTHLSDTRDPTQLAFGGSERGVNKMDPGKQKGKWRQNH